MWAPRTRGALARVRSRRARGDACVARSTTYRPGCSPSRTESVCSRWRLERYSTRSNVNRQHKKIVKVDLTSTRERKRFEVESPEVALALFRKAHRTVDDRSNVTLRVLVAWFVERCKVCHNVDLQDLTKTSHRRCAVHLHTTQAGTARSRHAEQAGPVMKLAGRREIRRVSLPRRYRDRRSCAYTRPAARPGAAGRRVNPGPARRPSQRHLPRD